MQNHRRLSTVAAWLAAGVLLLSGCAGYQIGNRSLYRADVQTVYVPVFRSDSFRRDLAERLTEAVVKEIELRTPYKVVHHPNADSVLTGRIVAEGKRVISENLNDEPRDIEADLAVYISWYDRRGDWMMQNATFSYAPLAFNVSQSANLIPEAGQSIATAHLESIQRLARQIVAQMEMPW